MRTHTSHIRLATTFVALVSAGVFLAGCGGGGGGGSDGGVTVSTGTASTTNTTTTTNTNTSSSGSPAALNTNLNAAADLPGIDLGGTTFSVAGASGAGGQFVAGDNPEITFSLQTLNKPKWVAMGNSEKSDIAMSDLTYGEIYLSGPSTNYQRVITLQDLLDSDMSDGVGYVRNSDGTYTFTLPAIPATYTAPYNDTVNFTDGELTGQAIDAGTYTIGIAAYKEYTVGTETVKDVVNYTSDILVGVGAVANTREVVKMTNCNQCHVTLQVHDGKRRDVKLCVLCHTSGMEDSNSVAVGDTTNVTLDFRVMIHKIHNGEHLPSVNGVGVTALGVKDYSVADVPYEINDDGTLLDYSDVAFPVMPSSTTSMPRDLGYSALSGTGTNGATYLTNEGVILKGVTACGRCHGDPDGAGSLTAPAQGSLHQIPSKRACGSCHDDIDWTLPYQSNGLTMAANQIDANCTTCHDATGAQADPLKPLTVEQAHTHPAYNSDATLWAVSNPGLNFNITAVKDSGGTAFSSTNQAVNGDAIDVTFTLKNDAAVDVGLDAIDSSTVMVAGPTTNPQPIMPMGAGNTLTVAPYDAAGRLASSSTTNKGTMGRVAGAIDTEILNVTFSSGTAYTVIGINPTTGAVDADWTGGAAIAGTAFPAATSVNKASNTATSVYATAAAVAQSITVNFTDPTNFTVTGSVSGAMGTGTLPASTSSSTLFTSTDGTVRFIIAAGTGAYAANDKVYLSVFTGPVGNPVVFALVAGRTTLAANDRFYYETIPAAASYTLRVPMAPQTEYLGDGTGGVGDVFTAANLPVYYGRQTVYERTALAGAAQALSANAAEYARYVDVGTVDAAWAAADCLVIEDGVANQEEYLLISYIDTTLKRIWFTTPARYAHLAAATIQEATLTFRQEGVNYTLNPALGTVTTVIAFGAGNACVMTYRTDGKFGWKKRPGGSAETEYFAPAYDSDSLGQDYGEWEGLSYQNGTYTVGLWGYKNVILGVQNEVQTYRGTGIASRANFLYGTATTITTHELISDPENCNACHGNVMLHGGSRRGFNTCVNCHSMAGNERYAASSSTTNLPGVTVDFRTMLHKIHRGEDLVNASTYQGGSFAEVVFPAMPGGVKHCSKCHGETSDAWKEPSTRTHASQTTPTKTWLVVCGSCHDSNSVTAHAAINTSGGLEACGTCHAPGADYGVELMHKNR